MRGGIWGPSCGSEASHELTLETLSHILWVSSTKCLHLQGGFPELTCSFPQWFCLLLLLDLSDVTQLLWLKLLSVLTSLPSPLTLHPEDAQFAQVLLRQKLGQVLDHPRCLFRNLLLPLALDSTVDLAWKLSHGCWGVPAATTVFLPIIIAPGQSSRDLLALSDIFQHISFPGKEKRLTERADGKGQA